MAWQSFSSRLKQKKAFKIFAIALLLSTSSIMIGRADQTKEVKSSNDPINIKMPQGITQELWQEAIPKDNLITPEKVALGEKLFFDARLSQDSTISCASCHNPEIGWADNTPTSTGVKQRSGFRNSPTILNAMFNSTQLWDGAANSLETQAKLALTSSREMGINDEQLLVKSIGAIPEYKSLFLKAFNDEKVTLDNIVKAIACFERTKLAGNAPFDRFMAGDNSAISPAAQRGWRLFRVQGRCITCHTFSKSRPFFSDYKFHNIGVSADKINLIEMLNNFNKEPNNGSLNKANDPHTNEANSEKYLPLGRYTISRQPEDIGAFKTPMLRNIAVTAPYMHDGSEETLVDVIKYYNKGGHANDYIDRQMKQLNLTDDQVNDLVEFLKSLTSDELKEQVETK